MSPSFAKRSEGIPLRNSSVGLIPRGAERAKQDGAGCLTRTGDLLITNQLLYQLS